MADPIAGPNTFRFEAYRIGWKHRRQEVRVLISVSILLASNLITLVTISLMLRVATISLDMVGRFLILSL